MTLFWRVVAINTGLMLAATLALVVSPATVSATLTIAELAVLAVGIVVVTAVNVLLLRRVFGPLERLASVMRRVEPAQPGRRITIERPVAEVADLARAFNDMLDRLEHERLSSGRRALAAQERERRRLARELHDELARFSLASACNSTASREASRPSWRRWSAKLNWQLGRASRNSARSLAGCDLERSRSSGCAAR